MDFIKDIDEKEKKELVKNITDFYNQNKENCDQYYEIARSTKGIYTEIKCEKEYKEYLVKSSVVILTANPFEKNILHMIAKGKNKIKHIQVNCSNNESCPLHINIYFFSIGEFNVMHLEGAQTGSYSIGGSADLVRYVIGNPFCYPSCIISFGICFGNDYKKQSLGDTIISRKVYPYFISAKVNDLGLTIADNNIFKINDKLDSRLKFLEGQNYFESDHVFYGNIITGEAVINNAIVKEIFTKAATNQPILGGEMESYGLFKECQGFSFSLPCLTLKSICDWGVAKNIDDLIDHEYPDNLKDRIQAYTAKIAYDVLEKLFYTCAGVLDKSIYDKYLESIKKLKSNKSHTLTEVSLNRISKKYQSDYDKSISQDCIDFIISVLSSEKILEKTDSKNVYKIN